MPDPRVAHCIFCDDIRFERGNKVSFMGLYSDELLVFAAKPARIRFAIVAWLICDIDDSPEQMTMRATGPVPGEKLFEGIFRFPKPTVPIGSDSKKVHLRAHLQLEGLEAKDDGEIAVFVDTDAGSIRAGRLRIRFVDQPPPEFPINLATNERLPSPGDNQPAGETASAVPSIVTPLPSPQSSDDAQETKKPGGADMTKRKKRKEPKGGSSSEQRLRAPLSRAVRKAKGKKL